MNTGYNPEEIMAHVAQRADQTALRQFSRTGRCGRSISFGELHRLSRSGASGLRRYGLDPQDRILLFIPPGIRFFTALLSILRFGATAVVANLKSLRLHFATITKDTDYVISAFPFTLVLGMIKGKSSIKILSFRKLIRITSEESETQDTAHTLNPGFQTFTTGTTGLPKPVYRDSIQLAAIQKAVNEVFVPQAGARDFCGMSSFLLNNLLSGEESLTAPSSLSPRRLSMLLRKQKAQRLLLSPGPLMKLARFCLQRDIHIESIETLLTGGAPMHYGKLEILRSVFPHARVVYVYGSSEAQPISSLGLNSIEESEIDFWRHGAGVFVGRPISRIQVKIDKPVAIGNKLPFKAPVTVGEVMVTGTHIRPPSQESEWLGTGDYGYFDPTGGLWLVGRLKHSRKKEGRILFPYPAEMEAESIEGIKRCGCLLPDEGENLLIIEPEHRTFRQISRDPVIQKALINIIEKQGLAPCGIRFIHRIPVDLRHHYRVDYKRLIHTFSKANP